MNIKNLLHGFTHHERGHSKAVLDHFYTASNITNGIDHGLAIFRHHAACNVVLKDEQNINHDDNGCI